MKFRPWRFPTTHEILAKQLADAERELLTAAQEREYFAAMEEMLARRVQRLSTEIHDRSCHADR